MNKVLWRCAAALVGAVLAVVCLTVPAQAAGASDSPSSYFWNG
jgi:hypothetical protein